MRTDIEFKAEDGTILRGWHYTPDTGAGPFPTIVMAHGYSAVKEMYLDKFAEHFAQNGMASLVFDNRNFGASDGAVRQEIDPWQQMRDFRDAITFAETLPADGCRPHRRVGLKLLGRACHRRGRHRSPREVRVGAGALDLGPRERTASHSGRFHRRVSRRPSRPTGARAIGRGTRHGPRGCAESARSLGTSHTRQLGLVHRDAQAARAFLAQRSDPALGRNVHGLRARRLSVRSSARRRCRSSWRRATY